jgi:hypothetical protein
MANWRIFWYQAKIFIVPADGPVGIAAKEMLIVQIG